MSLLSSVSLAPRPEIPVHLRTCTVLGGPTGSRSPEGLGGPGPGSWPRWDVGGAGRPPTLLPLPFPLHTGFFRPEGQVGARRDPSRALAGSRQHGPAAAGEGGQPPWRGWASLRLWGAPPSPHSLPVRETDGEPSDILRASSRGQGPLLRQPGSRWRCDSNQKEEKRRLACGPRGQKRGRAQAWMGGREAESAARPWGCPAWASGPLSGNPCLVNMGKLPHLESSSTDPTSGEKQCFVGPSARPGEGAGQ